jgi:hypothetical protein
VTKIALIFLLIISTSYFYAQTINLTGIWKGRLSQDDKTWAFDLTLNLKQIDNLLTGTSTIVANDGSRAYVTHQIKGEINKNEITLIDISVNDENNNSGYLNWCKKSYTGTLLVSNNTLSIKGIWNNDGRKIFSNKIIIDNSNSYCYPGTYNVTKEITGEKTLEDKALAALLFLGRKIEVKNKIATHSDSVLLSFYDNGEIDNDTISVYYNKTLIINHQRLSHTPIKVYVATPKQTTNEIIMFAENEGTVPPNTATLVIVGPGVSREVRVDSNTYKSEGIVLKRE